MLLSFPYILINKYSQIAYLVLEQEIIVLEAENHII